MIRRIDQQLRVNRMMLEQVDLRAVKSRRQRAYMLNYLEIVTAISTILLIRSGTEEHLQKKRMLWAMIRKKYPWVYHRLRRRPLSRYLNLPGRTGRKIAVGGYKISQRIFGFN